MTNERFAVLDKYHGLVNRLVKKMQFSQTPVPGFITGLSGTDSIVTFMMLCDAAKEMQIPRRVMGIHYVNAQRTKPTWFEQDIIPWLRDRHPDATILVVEPLGGNQDQQRWADLHLRALNEIDLEGNITPRDAHDIYWVAGSINATEFALGKYSMLATCVSLQPIQTLYKSMILKICDAFSVPAIAAEYSRIPDCWCGRDELAAQNIELIDGILGYDADYGSFDEETFNKLFAYVRDLRKENGFKQRVPYRL